MDMMNVLCDWTLPVMLYLFLCRVDAEHALGDDPQWEVSTSSGPSLFQIPLHHLKGKTVHGSLSLTDNLYLKSR